MQITAQTIENSVAWTGNYTID